ncbi:MAG: hypothetical protein A2787_08935 [Omnitrophica WOR_2 bacterium RIFCSPHIGHO2_01_FULL_48_9]|nr:MAG: hypothetical protein A2787_08935 [Omnitrophica WOR_2 bacterium RIFCSPHIGHO2_01_FULL_48_9]
MQLGQKSAAAQTFISTGSFHWAAPASQTATPINKPVTKPFYFPVSEEGQKTHLKSTFAAQKSSMGKGAENTQIPGVNTAPPTYQPLRLYPDDKN